MFPLQNFDQAYINLITRNLSQNGCWSFNALRNKRRHAGVDLYCNHGAEVIAMYHGSIRNINLFYKNTYAIEIENKTSLCRYCEIKPAANLKVGDAIQQGQLIGYVEKIDGLNQAMLHFEMYGNPLFNKGNLTDLNNPVFLRRADLINPTYILKGLWK